MREIPLTQGKVALVDDETHEYLSQFHWSVDGSGYPQRAVKTEKGWRPLRMHRDLLGLGAGEAADHVNGDKLDNRRTNLRRCCQSENNRNVGIRATNRSGFKGVYFNKKRNGYQAYITSERRHIYLGYHPTAEAAARAYDKKAKEIYGAFARLNFPTDS